jgi:hypothetical protein
MPDWDTRLVITIDGKVLSPISTFTPTFTLQKTVIHSIESDNVGAVHQPQTATFTMTLMAMGPNVAELTKYALEGKKFNIQVAEQTGTDWTFKKLLFRDCLITSAMPSNVVIDAVPQATFNGIILGFTSDKDIET